MRNRVFLRSILLSMFCVMAVCSLVFASGTIFFRNQTGQFRHLFCDSVVFSKTDAKGVTHPGYVVQNVYHNGAVVASFDMSQNLFVNLKEDYVSLQDKEYLCLADNTGSRNNFITNLSRDEIVIETDVDWLTTYQWSIFSWDGREYGRISDYSWDVKSNYSKEERIGHLIIGNKDYTQTDTLTVVQSPKFFSDYVAYEIGDPYIPDFYTSKEGDIVTLYTNHVTDVQVVSMEPRNIYGYIMSLYKGDVPCLWDTEKDKITVETFKDSINIIIPENKEDAFKQVVLSLEFTINDYGREYIVTKPFTIYQVPSSYPTYEEINTALTAFYNSLDRASQREIDRQIKDGGRNYWSGKDRSHPYPVRLNLFVGSFWDPEELKINPNSAQHTLTGTIPEEMALLMPLSIELAGNDLYGTIPESCLNHPNWNSNGWQFVYCRSTWAYDNGLKKGGYTNTDFKLKLEDDSEVQYVDGTTGSLFDLLKKNKVTCFTSLNIASFDSRVNLYLDYKDKGYGVVVYDNDSRTIEEAAAKVQAFKNKNRDLGFDDIDYTYIWGYRTEPLYQAMRFTNSSVLFDDEGRFVEFIAHNGGTPEYWYCNTLDSIVQSRVGEPVKHPSYGGIYYSSDYSKDGELEVLQQATVGKGINLVFLGDGYVDKDLEVGGPYDELVHQQMEALFSVEPYRSMRNRFNVYKINVVSHSSNYWQIGDKALRIKESHEVCFDYASKIPDYDAENIIIHVLSNYDNGPRNRSYCQMYMETNTAVSFDFLGTPHVIIHETGGHGIGKLGDEYIDPGFEDNLLDDPENTGLGGIHEMGLYLNIDGTNDPDKIAWSRLLKDERYKNEVGIFEGAYRIYGKGCWRSSETSVMLGGVLWFNVPSREAIYKNIMKWSEGDSWQYDYEEFVKWDKAHPTTYDLNAAPKKSGSQKTCNKEYEHRPPRLFIGSPKGLKNVKELKL